MPSQQPLYDILIGSSWTIAIAALLIGWGLLVTKLSARQETKLWEFGGLGIVVYVIVSAYLDMLSLANRTNLVILLLLGSVGFLKLILDRNHKANIGRIIMPDANSIIAYAILSACGLIFVVIGANNWLYGASWDDTSGYWPICQQLSSFGNSEGPLSFRRSLSLGGQYPLQTLGMLYTSEMGGYIYDKGLGAILCTLFSMSVYKRLKSKRSINNWIILGLCVLIIILPQYTLNSAPAVLLTVLTMLAYKNRKSLLLLGLISGAAISLRSQAILPMGLIGCYALYEIYKTQGLKESIKFISTNTIGVLLALCPGMVLSYSQFQTPWVFLNPGTVTQDYVKFENSWEALSRNSWDLILNCMPIICTCLLCIWGKLCRPLNIISLATLVLLFISMPEYSSEEWNRYAWPYASAGILLGASLISTKRIGTQYLAAPLALLISTMCITPLTLVRYNYVHSMNAYQKVATDTHRWELGMLAQKEIPEEVGIIVIARQPTLLDFTRNKLVVWDSFPAVGNPPKTSDLQAWRDWAAKYGAHYIMMEDWEKPTRYNEYLNKELTLEEVWAGKGEPKLPHYVRVWYPNRYKYINIIKELTKRSKSWKTYGYTIIDLNSNKD